MRGDAAADFVRIVFYAALPIGAVLTGAINRIKKFRYNLHLTTSRQTLRYVKRRQG